MAKFFEANFIELFNGLMIRGAETVNKVFLAVFLQMTFLKHSFHNPHLVIYFYAPPTCNGMR